MPYIKPVCPRCNCASVYHRKGDDTFVCRTCGTEWKRNEKGAVTKITDSSKASQQAAEQQTAVK